MAYFIWLLLLLPAALRADLDSGLVEFLVGVQSAAKTLADPNQDFDTKRYVDQPLKQDLTPTETAFRRLTSSNNGSISNETFSKFLHEFLQEPGSDLVNYSISGFYCEPPGFLPNLKSDQARKFALDVHAIWKVLARKVADEVHEKPLRHTLLPLPRPVVVPGSRYREVYYWDSYWIVRGLLVSKLYDAATSLAENLINLVNTYGFIPNGARRYYTNRSQPPLFSEMVRALYLETRNISLVERAFPALLKEHEFWSSDAHRVSICDKHGIVHQLARYNANWSSPRPESFTDDVKTAEDIRDHQQKAELYHQIATAAETGWDFSSRWNGNRYNRTTLKTSYILPVDLNCFLFQMEKNIDYFGKLLKYNGYSGEFNGIAEARRAAVNAILWSEEKNQYLDYWLVARNTKLTSSSMNFSATFEFDERNQNTDAFPSNFFPLWCGVVPRGDEKVSKLISSFLSSGLLSPGGVTTSLTKNTKDQQWDYPNAWAPIQHILAEGFAATKTKEGLALAKDIVRRWLSSNYVYFRNSKQGLMVEKYDATFCGKPGAGAQAGFGWSNGVVLSFLDVFGWPMNTKLSCDSSDG